MIRRLNDGEIVNAIANHPSVRSMIFLGLRYDDNPLDFTDCVADPKNFVLEDDGFCAIFGWSAPGVYECHVMGVKDARGAPAMATGHAMLAYMKEQGATMVWGQPSIYNKPAICYIRRMGLKSWGFATHPMLGEVEYFVTEYF